MKFVVVGAPRTGTTMFLVTLNTLKEFDVYGEIFGMNRKNPVPHPQKHIDMFRTKTYNAAMNKQSNENKFLDWLYSTGENVGFKFLYQHAMKMKRVVNYINNRNIYKVHLLRRNPVKRAVSGLLNRYHHYGEGTNKLKPENLLRFINNSKNWDNKLFKIFGDDRYMSMYYEDFTKDTNAEEMDFTEVFNFFDIDINPMVKIPTKKYGPDKLKDRVENYNEIHKYFEKNAPEYLKYVEE